LQWGCMVVSYGAEPGSSRLPSLDCCGTAGSCVAKAVAGFVVGSHTNCHGSTAILESWPSESVRWDHRPGGAGARGLSVGLPYRRQIFCNGACNGLSTGLSRGLSYRARNGKPAVGSRDGASNGSLKGFCQQVRHGSCNEALHGSRYGAANGAVQGLLQRGLAMGLPRAVVGRGGVMGPRCGLRSGCGLGRDGVMAPVATRPGAVLQSRSPDGGGRIWSSLF